MSRTVTLRYFAWIRERIGSSEETVELGDEIETVHDLLRWLPTRGETYAEALKEPDIVRVALDHRHAQHSQRLAQTREIALFPPMTGG